MQTHDDKLNTGKGEGFAAFFIKRIALAVILVAAVLWLLALSLDYLEKPGPWKKLLAEETNTAGDTTMDASPSASPSMQNPSISSDTPAHPDTDINQDHPAEDDAQLKAKEPLLSVSQPEQAAQDMQIRVPAAEHADAMIPRQALVPPPAADTEMQKSATRPEHPAAVAPPVQQKQQPAEPDASSNQQVPSHAAPVQTAPLYKPAGVAFVEAVIQPIDYELNQRFWGWRPNDILNVTDNINQFQLGTLEVTRRSVVQLAERISRTGSTDAFNRNLENAMNWLMIKADSYWFPSPETKYKESLAELEDYKKSLMADKASFYTRADNLIPLLAAYEDLLGSCDENLVKFKEADGSTVGFFKADNYFYYAKGVANAMANILEAVNRDFSATLDSRHGTELLHHAIVSCRLAASLDPWIVTNASLDGILANHRANMAAPISHARYFIGQLIKTLST